MDFVAALTGAYKAEANAADAAAMEKYMKGRFPFFGIKMQRRREIAKQLLLIHKKEIKAQPRQAALQLYSLPQREFHYCGIEILVKELKKKYVPDDEQLIKHLITTHSWWDSVDTIAKFILGNYLKQYPEKTAVLIKDFSGAGNMWLNRSALLFQLGYKKDTDAGMLFSLCEQHKESKEFFIQKAIGWALREYGKTNPDAVRQFVSHAGLKPLSTREALKNL